MNLEHLYFQVILQVLVSQCHQSVLRVLDFQEILQDQDLLDCLPNQANLVNLDFL